MKTDKVRFIQEAKDLQDSMSLLKESRRSEADWKRMESQHKVCSCLMRLVLFKWLHIGTKYSTHQTIQHISKPLNWYWYSSNIAPIFSSLIEEATIKPNEISTGYILAC